jgi:hypothetical protein
MIQKITNIDHTITNDPYHGYRHNFGLTLTNLNDDQAVKFWQFIGELHIEEPDELEPGWSSVLVPLTDDEVGSA